MTHIKNICIFLSNNLVESDQKKREAFLQNLCYGIYITPWNLLQKYVAFKTPY